VDPRLRARRGRGRPPTARRDGSLLPAKHRRQRVDRRLSVRDVRRGPPLGRPRAGLA
jgi:hypothetical protein